MRGRGDAIGLALLVAIAASGACTPARESCDQPRDEVRIALNLLPNTLDWSRSAVPSDPNYPVIHALMRGLTVLDEQHHPAPGLADRWEIRQTPGPAPHEVYTFHLHPGIVWSDGKTPLTARDFVFGWKRALLGADQADLGDILGADAVIAAASSAELAALPAPERAARLKTLLDAVALEAPDDLTFRVTLTAPKSYFLARVAYVYVFFPQPAALLEGKTEEEITRWFNEPEAGHPAVLGAFRVDEWDRLGNAVTLSANPFDPFAPAAGRVRRLVLVKAALSPILYERCKIDFVAMDDPASLARAPADLARSELLSTYWLGINAATVDLPMRRALGFALDRPALTRGLLPVARPAFGYVPEDMIGGARPGDPLTKDWPVLDLAKAKSLLAESKTPHTLSMLVRTGTFLPETGIAENLRKQLEPLGVTVNVTTSADFGHDIRSAEGKVRYDLFLRRTGADYAHPQTFLSTFDAGGNHFTSFETVDGGAPFREYRELLARGAAEADPERMTEDYTRAQDILIARAAVLVPLYHPDRYSRKRTWIDGLGFDPFNFLTFHSMRIHEKAAR